MYYKQIDENYLYSAQELMDLPFTPTEIQTMKRLSQYQIY